MHITFIMPSVGRKANSKKYIRSWMMEPLGLGVLSSLTPREYERSFFDDRFEKIDFEIKTDVVCLSCETYTARRAYEIAYRFRNRGIPVILGGFHPTLVPDEAEQYADAIVVGEAEDIWKNVLEDLKSGNLKKRYKANGRPSLKGVFPDRELYRGKDYLPLRLVETGRGCMHNCEFCTIHPFYNQSYIHRPIEDVVGEIAKLRKEGSKHFFFVDDNIVSDPEHAKELFRRLIPLKIRWFSQGTINIAKDDELMRLMRDSGCMGVLIGFESLDDNTLKKLNKEFNFSIDREEAISKIHSYDLKIYATFVFGNDEDKKEVFEHTYEFAKKHKFFVTAYNHIVPFPGSALFERLNSEGRIFDDQYWLNHDYTFGKVCYQPKNFSADELTELCYYNRKRIYSIRNLLGRFFVKRNFTDIFTPLILLFSSILAKIDVGKRQGLPMGFGEPFRND